MTRGGTQEAQEDEEVNQMTTHYILDVVSFHAEHFPIVSPPIHLLWLADWLLCTRPSTSGESLLVQRSLIQLFDEFSAFPTVYANAIVFRQFCIILFRILHGTSPSARCSPSPARHQWSIVVIVRVPCCGCRSWCSRCC